ncbi:hypothetical protein CR513_02053, partial [Mucuna pruriens]
MQKPLDPKLKPIAGSRKLDEKLQQLQWGKIAIPCPMKNETLSINKYVGSVLIEEMRRKAQSSSSQSKGIKHEKTPPKTLQLNCLAERMNMTLIERIRCMLSEARLPKHLWSEALYTAVHVINLSPTVVMIL